MKKVILTLVIGLTILSVNAQKINCICAVYDGIEYFPLSSHEKKLLKLFNMSYSDPEERINSLKHLEWRFGDSSAKANFEIFINSNNTEGISILPDTNHIVMTGFDLLEKNNWYDYDSENIFSILANIGYTIIGYKEFSLPEKSKGFKIWEGFDDEYEMNPNNFMSIIVIEEYFPTHNQIGASIILRHKNGRLVDPGMNFMNVIENKL